MAHLLRPSGVRQASLLGGRAAAGVAWLCGFRGFRGLRPRSRREERPRVARPMDHVEQHLAAAVRLAVRAVAVVQKPPVAAGRLQHGAVPWADPALVRLEDGGALVAAPRSVDALRAGDPEGVPAGGRRAAATARVEEVEPVVAADDARSLDQAALPAVAAADHDLARRPGQAQPVGAQLLHPDRARAVAAVLLPQQEWRAVLV